jgi:hypothetical protein
MRRRCGRFENGKVSCPFLVSNPDYRVLRLKIFIIPTEIYRHHMYFALTFNTLRTGHLNRLNARSRSFNNLNQLLYCVFFWVFPRSLSFKSRRFGTLYRFHLPRQVKEEWLGLRCVCIIYTRKGCGKEVAGPIGRRVTGRGGWIHNRFRNVGF